MDTLTTGGLGTNDVNDGNASYSVLARTVTGVFYQTNDGQ
jgi:hypothetical protein